MPALQVIAAMPANGRVGKALIEPYFAILFRGAAQRFHNCTSGNNEGQIHDEEEERGKVGNQPRTEKRRFRPAVLTRSRYRSRRQDNGTRGRRHGSLRPDFGHNGGFMRGRRMLA